MEYANTAITFLEEMLLLIEEAKEKCIVLNEAPKPQKR